MLYTLRGHDSKIISMDWMRFKLPATTAVAATSKKNPIKKDKTKRRARPKADTSDLFDIYSFDHLEDEFGTMIDKPVIVSNAAIYDPNVETNIQNNEKFDFVEACQTLKDDILLGTNPADNLNLEVKSNDIETIANLEKDSHQNNSLLIDDDDDDDVDEEKDNLSHEFEEINETFDDDTDNDTDDNEELLNADIGTVEIEEIFCVASSSMLDNHIWLWDTKTGVGMQKIELKKNNSHYHYPRSKVNKKENMFNNIICWLNNSMLAILSSLDGHITVCNVSWMGENKYENSK